MTQNQDVIPNEVKDVGVVNKQISPLPFKEGVPSLERFDKILDSNLKSIGYLKEENSNQHNIDLEYAYNPKINCPFRKEIYLPNLKEVRYVDCGKCLICAKKKAYKLYCRILLECSDSKRPLFLTYTYNNFHYETICPRALQLVFKKLRFHSFNFKYVLVGEYGPRTLRSHYHVLYLVAPNTDDAKFLQYATSFWYQGNVKVEPADSFASYYLSSYLKKNFTDTYTFTSYSKRPAIGVIKPNQITDAYMEAVINNKLPFFVNQRPLYISPDILASIYNMDSSDSIFEPLKEYESPGPVSIEELTLYENYYIDQANKFKEKKLKFNPKNLE